MAIVGAAPPSSTPNKKKRNPLNHRAIAIPISGVDDAWYAHASNISWYQPHHISGAIGFLFPILVPTPQYIWRSFFFLYRFSVQQHNRGKRCASINTLLFSSDTSQSSARSISSLLLLLHLLNPTALFTMPDKSKENKDSKGKSTRRDDRGEGSSRRTVEQPSEVRVHAYSSLILV